MCLSSLNCQSSRDGSNIKTTVCALSLISKLFTDDDDAKILENDEQALCEFVFSRFIILKQEMIGKRDCRID